MRKTNGTDPVFQNMIQGNDEIVFNLFYLIKQDESASIYTNDISYITAQSNYKAPLWIYINENLDKTALTEIKEIIKNSLSLNANVHINAQQKYFLRVIDELKKDDGIEFAPFMHMWAYTCKEVKDVVNKGECVTPCAEYKQDMAKLIKQMAKDAEGQDLSDIEANGFANAMQNSKTLFLWKDKEIVSMAKIRHKTQKYARINTVVTDRAHRGNGYAKMLVGEISKTLLQSGITPMLYADADYPSSNIAYQNIGYVKVGDITEFLVASVK